MTIMPPQTPLEWLLYNPMGTILTGMLLVMMLALGIRIYLDWPTMQVNLSLTQICIGGACP